MAEVSAVCASARLKLGPLERALQQADDSMATAPTAAASVGVKIPP